jgi:hypothetical protein
MAPKKKRRTKTRRRVRVYVLGAGVSASCGIAVAKDLLRESISRLASRDSHKTKEVHSLLRYLYPGFDDELGNYPNIEDFLNLLEMAKTFNSEEFIESSLWPRERLNGASRIVLKAVTDYLWGCVQSAEKLVPIREFATRHLKPNDVVITFNWDVTLERGLYERDDFSIPYFYSRDKSEEDFVILKPHGSIDWFKKSALPENARKGAQSLDQEVCVYPHFSFAKDPKVSSLQPVIVPPVTAKEFQFNCLRKTWRSVYRAISDATELIVIGYSLPKEDQFARLVFRRAIRSNQIKADRGDKRQLKLTVVNPDDTVANTFTRLAAQKTGIRFLQVRFDDYINWLRGPIEEPV